MIDSEWKRERRKLWWDEFKEKVALTLIALVVLAAVMAVLVLLRCL